MCPVCLATAAVIAGKATSAGSMVALVLKKVVKTTQTKGEMQWLRAKRS